MAYEQQEGWGALFRNTRKSNAKAPDYNGSCKIGGVEYDLAGWKKTSKDGKTTFLNLKLQPQSERRERPRANGAQRQVDPDDDSVPF